jgi:ribonuclease G
MVRIHQVGRTAASALLLDESGEVISAPERTPAAARGGRPRAKRRTPSGSRESKRAGTPDPARDGEDPRARREAGTKASSEDTRPQRDEVPAASADVSEGDVAADGKPDDLQSKPRRRGRRGGRRRSAAKARASTE